MRKLAYEYKASRSAAYDKHINRTHFSFAIALKKKTGLTQSTCKMYSQAKSKNWTITSLTLMLYYDLKQTFDTIADDWINHAVWTIMNNSLLVAKTQNWICKEFNFWPQFCG